MKKLLLLSIVLLSSLVTLNAREVDHVGICKSLNFDFNSNLKKCFTSLSKDNVRHFSNGAMEVCASYDFDSHRNNCVDAAINKSYFPSEVKHCKNLTFDSEKTNCMIKNGREAKEEDEAVDSSKVIDLILRAKRFIRNGESKRAQRTLNRVLDILENE